MASKIDYSSLTLNAREAQNVNEAVFSKTFTRPELATIHGLQTDVDMDRFIPIYGQFGLVGKVDPSSCSVNTSGETIPVAQKKWEPKLISDRLIHCQKDISSLVKLWQLSRKAAGTWEEINNEQVAFINDRLSDAVYQSILRISSFGDTAADTVANGGVLKNGTDKAFWTMLDGMWKQIFTDQALGATAKAVRYTITENSEATEAAQLALASGRAYLAMESMLADIDSRVFEGNSKPAFQMSNTMFTNYKNYLREKSLNFTLDKTTSNLSGLNFDGYPIIVRHDWDRFIKTYENDGTVRNLPHRIVLADINNIPIGTSDAESMSEFTSVYDPITKKHYMDFAYKIDMKVLEADQIAVAY